MIAPVAVSTTTLADTGGLTGELLLNMRRGLVKVLLAHGQLVFADERARAAFAQQVRVLYRHSPELLGSWTELLMLSRTGCAPPAAAPTPLEEVHTFDALGDWEGVVELAVVDPAGATRIGCHPPDNVSWTRPGSQLELTCHDRAPGCRTLRSLNELASVHKVHPGTDRELIWGERMAPLVRVARHIHLQDRFLGERLLNKRAGGGEPQETEWLLERIAGAATQARLTLYSWYGRADDRGRILREFRRAVKSFVPSTSGIECVELHLVPRAKWNTRVGHDRHLRADDAGLEVSTGFDRFAEAKLTGLATVVYMYSGADLRGLQDAEAMVRDIGRPPIRLA